jgi:hypothetical protein
MKKRIFALIFGIALIFSTMLLVSAAPPFTPQINGDYEIIYPQIYYIEQDQAHTFEFHVNNFSNGVLLTNSSITCRFHLYNSLGDTFEIDNIHNMDTNLIDWKIVISKGNFTRAGEMGYLFACNSSAFSGEASVSIFVNSVGNEFTTAQAILYGLLISLIGLFLFFSISGIRKTEEGAWLIAYICLTYILVYALMGIFYLIANNFLWVMPIVSNILYIIWFVMGIGFLPFAIVLSLYILGQEARATLEHDYMKQGYSRDESRELSRRNR